MDLGRGRGAENWKVKIERIFFCSFPCVRDGMPFHLMGLIGVDWVEFGRDGEMVSFLFVNVILILRD